MIDDDDDDDEDVDDGDGVFNCDGDCSPREAFLLSACGMASVAESLILLLSLAVAFIFFVIVNVARGLCVVGCSDEFFDERRR